MTTDEEKSKYENQLRYFRTKAGKEAKRIASAVTREKHREKVLDYETSEERKKSKSSWAKKSRQRTASQREVILLLGVVAAEFRPLDKETTDFYYQWLLYLHRDRRFTMSVTNPNARKLQ